MSRTDVTGLNGLFCWQLFVGQHKIKFLNGLRAFLCAVSFGMKSECTPLHLVVFIFTLILFKKNFFFYCGHFCGRLQENDEYKI